MPLERSGGVIFMPFFRPRGRLFVILRHGKTQRPKTMLNFPHIIGRNVAGASLTQPPIMYNPGTERADTKKEGQLFGISEQLPQRE